MSKLTSAATVEESPTTIDHSNETEAGASETAVNDRHQTYLDTKTFGSLDGLRALCILAVIWHHVPDTGLDWSILGRGFLGVDMFFVLSGFLIVTLLLREHARNGVISLRKFYARRTLRIFPIYYLIIFGTLAAYLVFKPSSMSARNYFQAFPFLVTYTSNWFNIQAGMLGIVWSLATEEQFYLVWPAVEKFLPKKAVLSLLLVVIAVNQMINFGIFDSQIVKLYGGPGANVPSIWQTTFTPIALGVLLAHLLHERKTFTPLSAILGHRFAGVVLCTVLLGLCQFGPQDLSGLPRLAIQLTMMFLLGSLVIREDHIGAPFLKLTPLPQLGMISYGMYLYHMYAIHGVRIAFDRLHWSDGNPLFFAGAVILTAFIAAVSFRCIERPLLRLKTRFAA